MFLSPRLKLYTIEFHVSFLARTLLLLCMIGMYLVQVPYYCMVPGTVLYNTLTTLQQHSNTKNNNTNIHSV